jgi:hypothetical protein
MYFIDPNLGVVISSLGEACGLVFVSAAPERKA